MSSWTVLRGLLSSVASVEQIPDQRPAAAMLECSLVADEDELVMEQVQCGAPQALAVLYDRYARLVLSIGLRILRDTSEAQELLQDVFLYVFQKSQDFDSGKGAFRSWLVQIAYSRAFNKREYLTLRRFYDYCQIDETLDSAPSDFSPERLGHIAELKAILQSAAAELTEAQRTTLEMFFWEGYSLREISARLKETLGNTRNHYYRGLEKLREVLKTSLTHSANGRK